MLHTAITKYEQQGKSIFNPRTFSLLSHPDLRIIELWEQATVCYNCSNFEQIVGTYPLREPKCSKCERQSLTARIYVLNKDFEVHKKNNKDLPLFICNAINRKIRKTALTSKDLAEFGIEGVSGDIDVFIEKTMTGIECKLRGIEFKATDDQLRSYGQEIKNDIEKYISVGIRNLVVVTNLDQEDASKLDTFLRNSIPGPTNELHVIPKSIHRLKEMISELIESVLKLKVNDSN